MKNILIFLFLLISPIIGATNYYVAKTGSDSNNGLTTGTAWLTINRAVYMSEIDPGDVVYVRTGTYNEKLRAYQIAGTLASPIVIQNYPGEYPIIDGTGIVPGDALVMIYGNYIHFIGFHVQNVNVGGTLAGAGGGILAMGKGSLISHCDLHDIRSSAIMVGGEDPENGDDSIIEYCTGWNLGMSNENGVLSESWATGISARRSPDNVIIRHCVVHDVWGEGISVYEATNVTIEDNIVYDWFSVGIYVSDATDNLVQRNLIYMTKTMRTLGSYGYGSWNEGQLPANARNTWLNNIAFGCATNFRANSMDNYTILNNTFVNATIYNCVNLDASSYTNSIFKNNIIIQENGLPVIQSIGTHTGLTFSNNLWSKTPDTDASGTGDVISTLHISKVGTYADTSYYALLSTSPAINGGTDVNVDYDYLGVARGVTFDIGALEYVEPGTPIDPIVIYTTSVYPSVTYATVGGNVVDDGGGTVSARGVCWGATANPTTAGSHTTNGTGTGTFIATLTPLTASTTYHARAYATNEAGTYYGEDVTFITSSTGRKRYVIYGGQ